MDLSCIIVWAFSFVMYFCYIVRFSSSRDCRQATLAPGLSFYRAMLKYVHNVVGHSLPETSKAFPDNTEI